jgi:hypothetical protein
MPTTTPIDSRPSRSVTLRGALATLCVAFLALVLGGAGVTHSAPAEGATRTRTVSPALDAWGMAHEGLDSVFGYLDALEAAEQWYSSLIMEDHWLRIGRCEQPGTGYGGINWYANGRNEVAHFQGGLGISTATWREHSAGYPSSALHATPHEQMAVATRVYHYYGPGAWGCK